MTTQTAIGHLDTPVTVTTTALPTDWSTVALGERDTAFGRLDVVLALGSRHGRSAHPAVHVVGEATDGSGPLHAAVPVVGVHIAGAVAGRGMSLAGDGSPSAIRRALRALGVATE